MGAPERFIAVLLIGGLIYAVDANVTCKTIKSSISGILDNDVASVSCPVDTKLVSCGGSTANATDSDFDGAYMSRGGTCYATNARGGNGVYAYARCCDFKPDDIDCKYTKNDKWAARGSGNWI